MELDDQLCSHAEGATDSDAEPRASFVFLGGVDFKKGTIDRVRSSMRHLLGVACRSERPAGELTTIVEVLWWGADLMGNAENTVSTVVESVILHLQNVSLDMISGEGWDSSGGMLK